MNLHLLPYTPERDVYRLLGVSASASTDEITTACRRLARTFHPDTNGSGRATEEMQVVNAVRQVLTDPQWRARYDRERHMFHAARVRTPERTLSSPTARAWEPIHVEPPRPSPLLRYLRAALIGARAIAAGLAPARCRSCRIVIEGDDAYCAACGTPLLTTS